MPRDTVLEVGYEIANEEDFLRILKQVADKTGDLRIPLRLIAADFYKSERAIWRLRGPGQYEDIVPETKERHLRGYGREYPILLGVKKGGKGESGKLRDSMLDPNNRNAINKIVNKRELIIGTKAKTKKDFLYPAAMQFGFRARNGRRVPPRPFLFIGPEAPKFASRRQMGRLERWASILREHQLQVAMRDGDGFLGKG